MRLVPLGVRGSTAAPGPEFVRYGGHTSCVVVFADGESVPRLVLDAGTGLRGLGGLTGGAAFHGAILLTHLHWDHVQGLPFCRVVDHREADVDVYVPVPQDAHALDVLRQGFSPPNFPIGPDGLLGHWRFVPLRPGRVSVPSADVRVAEVSHKGGVTVAVRVELDGTSVVYAPDHALADPDDPLRPEALELAHGADLLVHDGQFVDGEEATSRAYGHATVTQAMAFADAAQVGALLLTHHSPERTDDQLDELAAAVKETPGGRPVTFAVQGESVPVLASR